MDDAEEYKRLVRQVEAVRALHYPATNWSRGRSSERCTEDNFLWPCPTIRAMDSAAERTT